MVRKNASKLPIRILLSNDDGINAPGLKALEKIADELSDDVWIVAPESEESGASRKLTLTQPLRLREISKQKYAVQGTPTDCVLMGVTHIMKDQLPDLVLSGVNRGSNIADDVTYSGHCGGDGGTGLGIPSIALTRPTGSRREAGQVVVLRAAWAVADPQAVEVGWPKDVLININFPDVVPHSVERVEVTSQGKRDQSLANIIERMDVRGNPYYWLGFTRMRSNPPEGTDLRAIYDGRISVTPLHLNLTEERARKVLAQHIPGAPPKLD
jgi:5'-nucleotidase